ncbi:PASTA domain-containing protein [Nonomuraea recticatena]|uniref:PASTA domain-containing protein n=1 Tax=Nonomuraea recticatena TaxID=46178 RepID=UPI00361D273D
MDRSAAVRAIKDAGLVVGSVSERDSARSPGEVLGSTPGAGPGSPEAPASTWRWRRVRGCRRWPGSPVRPPRPRWPPRG